MPDATVWLWTRRFTYSWREPMRANGQAGAHPAVLHRSRLEAFVVRARRVDAHSLAADGDAMVALSGMPYVVTALGNGEVHILQECPAEEVVESAAARIRPRVVYTVRFFSVATERVTVSMPATHEAPVPLGEVFEVSTHRRRSRVGSVFCRT
ncbi:hypothetical protein ABZT06_40020 [Streptomyces sp. NPDC005483]|uniref:hypothetical protein n=1 Tax=Streptomyces sp. NPDC005483 TaxID=3154882 RepID=UPI0033AD9676